MDDLEVLATRFEKERPRLRAVAYRMLGSVSEAEDAVQEAWLRLGRSAHGELDDLGAWLVTVVARIALNMLRSRKTRSESRLPDPILEPSPAASPEQETLLASTVGLALLVVLETLPPAERVAFVLHDIFGLPFEEIAPIVERTPEAARQLASRGRRRVQARHPGSDADLHVQKSVVDAFLAASRSGDFQGLVAILDPDVVLRNDAGKGTVYVRGAENVARRAQAFSRGHAGAEARSVLINGSPGLVGLVDGKLFSVVAFTVRSGRIVEMDILSDRERIARLDITALGT